VAARRLILVMLVLLVLSSILAALIPVDRNQARNGSTSSVTTTTVAPLPTGKLLHRTIATDDPTPKRIKLNLGDQLELTVTSAKLADQVEIPAFGELENVDPNLPARFDLLALEPGSFAVRLVEAKRVIGRIEVAPRSDHGKRGKSRDPPGSRSASSTPGASSLS
jgi:hypothetical protein